MRIERLTVREIEMPLRAPFVTAIGKVNQRRLLVVELEDRDGTPGWAECVAGAVPGYSAETVDSSWETITVRLAPRVVGLETGDPSDVIAVIRAVAPVEPMAQAAVEMACWDLAARRENLSLASLLGGTRRGVPAGIALGLRATPADTAEAAAAAVAEGYHRVKLKIQPDADLEVVRAVRERIGYDPMLTVDANGAYTRSDLDHLAALDEYQLRMIEQPLARDDLEGHAELQKRLETPVCLDESIATVADLVGMITLDAGRVLNLKPGRVGGITAALTMVELATDNGIDLWLGGMLETGIGRAHNVALAALEAFDLPGDLSPSDRYWEQDVVHPPWTMEAGILTVPHATPGIGVEVDQARIKSLARRVQEVHAAL